MTLVEITVAQRVATITLNAPNERNSLTAAMVEEIVAGVDELEADEGVGALVITGAPPAFCAGANLASLADTSGDGAERGCATSTRASCGSVARRCPRWPPSTAPPWARA